MLPTNLGALKNRLEAISRRDQKQNLLLKELRWLATVSLPEMPSVSIDDETILKMTGPADGCPCCGGP